MRILIIDDEPLARKALVSALSSRSDIDEIDSACDAVEALEKTRKSPFDVLLLDINMPELSGLELVDSLKKRAQPLPSIVFVTAHHEHALAAFEKHAADYILKPFTNERLNDAVDTAFRRTAAERAANLLKVMEQVQTTPRPSSKIAIKAKGRILFINPAEIIAVEAEGNYVLLLRESGSYLLRESISALTEKLKTFGFIRIHRSVLVNSSFVEEIQPWATGEYMLRIKGGKEYNVTRTFKKNLGAIAEFWLGTDAFLAD